jgi:ubiquinone biosynthesis protein
MRTTIRRLRLLFCLLRYGARVLWAAAPKGRKLDWIAGLVAQLHASPDARAALHRALPQLGPLASALAGQAIQHPRTLTGSLHDAFALIARTEAALAAPLAPSEVIPALHAAIAQRAEPAFAGIDLAAMKSGIAEEVHAARLAAPEHPSRADGGYVEVAIKLLRVREVERIGDDLAVLGWVARLLEHFVPAARELQLHGLVKTLAAEIEQHFDLRTEAANLSQTGRHFSDDPRVLVPEVVWRLSTDHALVIERIETLGATELEALRRRGVDLEALAERIVEVVVEQAFSHGFFHAALDAERLRVSVEPRTLGKLVFGDGKTMATLTEPEREFFIHGASALFEQNYGRLAQMHREAGHVAPDTRDEVLEGELRMRAEPHFAAPTERRSPGALLQHLLTAIEPFDGEVSPALALAHQALMRAESLARRLAPSVDTWSVVKGTLKALAREDVDHRGWIKRLAREMPHLAMMPRVPTLFVQRLQDRYDARAHRAAPVATEWLAQLRHEQRVTRRLLWACALCGALLGAGAIWLGA